MEVPWRRRIVLTVGLVVALLLAYTILYQWALATFEGVSVGPVEALQVVVEAITTAGFGGDTQHWESPFVNALVILMNLSGVLLVFLAIPAFVVPLIREALQEVVPTSTDRTDHVILCSHSPHEDVLLADLAAADVPVVIVEEDPSDVEAHVAAGRQAMLGDPEETETFQRANVDTARAVVVDVADDRNPTVILSARECRDDIPILSVAEETGAVSHQQRAGATHVVHPRAVLGRSLGRHAAGLVTRELADIQVGTDLEFTELVVKADSALAGATIRDGLPAQVTVVGMWDGGTFVPAPSRDRRIRDNAILLVAGKPAELDVAAARSLAPHHGPDRVVVAGYGEVGRTVERYLVDEDVAVTIIDREDGTGVDHVGDATEAVALEAAGVDEARALVLALDDDRTTVNATLAAREVTTTTDVIVRANDPENVQKLYRAGADYVLALTTVTGRMLTGLLFDDEEVITAETQFAVVKTAVPELVGERLEDVTTGTDAVVVAIERDGTLLTEFDPDLTLEAGDELVVAGSDAAVSDLTGQAH